MKTRVKATLRTLKVTAPFFVYIGTLQPRKNLERLIEAFEIVVRKTASSSKKQARQPIPQLVIAGKVGWLADGIVERVKRSPAAKHIVMTGFVTELQKEVLLQEAEATLLVGLYEGFGIPPLESLHYQTVPIVANTSSLPEVVGPAGILVDPLKPPSIAEGMLQVLHASAKQRAQWRRAARQQVNTFSWEKSAQLVLETLTSVAYREHTRSS